MAKEEAVVAVTPFERAKAAFEDSEHPVRFSERMDVCPTCGEPMRIRKEYKDPEQYHFIGTCTNDPSHDIERYGYFSNEGSD